MAATSTAVRPSARHSDAQLVRRASATLGYESFIYWVLGVGLTASLRQGFGRLDAGDATATWPSRFRTVDLPVSARVKLDRAEDQTVKLHTRTN
jgi:hypothetical protein